MLLCEGWRPVDELSCMSATDMFRSPSDTRCKILLYYWLDVLNQTLNILSKACPVAFGMRKSESSKELVLEGRQVGHC